MNVEGCLISCSSRLKLFLQRGDRFTDGNDIALSETRGPSHLDHFAKTELRPDSEWKPRVKTSKNPRPGLAKPLVEDRRRADSHLNEERQSPAGRQQLDGRERRNFPHYEQLNKAILNPLTGWVQTPAVRPRDGGWPPLYALDPDPTMDLEKSNFLKSLVKKTSTGSLRRTAPEDAASDHLKGKISVNVPRMLGCFSAHANQSSVNSYNIFRRNQRRGERSVLRSSLTMSENRVLVCIEAKANLSNTCI